MFNSKICGSNPGSRRFKSLVSSTALAVAIAGGIFTLSAGAQDAPSQDSPAQPAAPAAPNAGGQRGHHQMPSVDDQVKHLTKSLKLSDDQQAKVRSALEDQRKQMEQIHSDSSLSRDDRFSKMKAIRDTTDTQIKSALNDDQQKKFDEMQQKRQQRMMDRQGPPPQQ
jgi:Spy/CpxP family protein refolding chaperone